MTRHKDGTTEEGFTLIEVMVAFTIVALTLGAVYAVIGSGTQGAGRASDALERLTRAENTMAQIGTEIPLLRRDDALGPDLEVLIVEEVSQRFGLTLWRVRVTESSGSGAPIVLETLRLGPRP